MKKLTLIAGLINLFSISVFAAQSVPSSADKTSKRIGAEQVAQAHLPFIENCGQFAEDIKFAVKTFAGTVYVNAEGNLVYAMPYASKANGKAEGLQVLREEFIDSSAAVISGGGQSTTRASFFFGRDSARWRSNLPTYESVEWQSLYPGIGLSVRAHGDTIEKVFSIAPGAEPEEILINISGTEKLLVDESGRLIARTTSGDVLFSAPVAYQEGTRGKEPVAVQYWVDGNKYGFELSDYDVSRQLIIDPLLGGTYLGGYRWDEAFALTMDGEDRIYVAGSTTSTDFPVTPGAYQTTKMGTDVFVSLFDNRLTNLIASTYLGGTGVQSPYAITVDTIGRVYITGDTTSTNFPTTPNAYQRVHQSGDTSDVFVAVMDSTLGSLIASTLLVGDESEYPDTIALDAYTNVYVAGVTRSTNFPTTVGAFQRNLKGWGDGFVSKLDYKLENLLASTYIGGSNYDRVLSVGLDASGDMYISGITGGNGFPTTNSPYSSTFNGGELDGFVSKMDSGFTNLLYSTYIGGSGSDWPNAVIPTATRIYIAGDTFSSNFPVTPGVYQTQFAGGTNDCFIAALDTALNQLLYSSFLGGSDFDTIEAMARQADGTLWAAGYTASSNFPTTQNAYCRTIHNNDAFVAKLDGQLVSLGASTLVGGSWDDYGLAIALDSQGNVFVTGYTEAWDFPTSPGAYERFYHTPNNPGWGDAFVIKMDSSLDASPAPPINVAASYSTFTDHITISWTASDNATGYSVWRNTELNTASAVAIMSSNETVTSFNDWEVTPGTDYYYWIKAANSTGPSAFSDPDTGARSPACPLAADLDGDAMADPIVVASGNWYAWLSGGNYVKVGPAVGAEAIWSSVAADLDNDGKADPTAMDPAGKWYSWFSSSGYTRVGPVAFGTGKASAVCADFDSDGLGDPAEVDGNAWHIWVSSAGYQEIMPLTYGSGDMIPLAADFDGDRYTDFARYLDGTWYAWISSAFYAQVGPLNYGEAGDLPVAADFDGDRFADLAIYKQGTGEWYVWLSSAGYYRVGPYAFHP
jgi:hypothetical protein